uniref:Uncharacterized protein n=1 Tax=viral metagenome TaxID=1070528 RepID=A0A6C0JSZ4_9ZZZZ
MFSCVNDKISGVFVTTERPLNDGEMPKHPGAGTVYEATNKLTPVFQDALASGVEIIPSWKIDGTCCKIENGVYYRRRDIRKGSVAPPGSILGDVDSTGHANIAWIPLNTSKNPEDKYHLSAFCPTFNKTHVWIMNADKSISLMALDSIKTSATFELIGPCVQDNLYEIETEEVSVILTKKGADKVERVPRHYLVPHGAFVAPLPMSIFSEPNPLDLLRKFVEENRAEGIVFRCADKYFKVNQGHLATHTKGAKLLLAGVKSSS